MPEPSLDVVVERLDSVKAVVEEVRTHVKATNGRVTRLERAYSYLKGAAGALVLVAGYLVETGHLHIT